MSALAHPELNSIVQTLINEIDSLDERFFKNESYSLDTFAQAVLDFFKHFGIEIRYIENPASFYIHLPKNTKEYFKGLLVDYRAPDCLLYGYFGF